MEFFELCEKLEILFRPLSKKERELLYGLLAGKTFKEIEKEYGIKVKNCWTYAERIRKKHEKAGIFDLL